MLFYRCKVEKLKWWFTATKRITIQTVIDFTPIFTPSIKLKITIRASNYCTMTSHFSLWKCLFTSQNKLWKCKCSKTVAKPEWRDEILWQGVLDFKDSKYKWSIFEVGYKLFFLIYNGYFNKLVSNLAKWLSVRLWTKWLLVRVQLQSLALESGICATNLQPVFIGFNKESLF